MINVLIFVHIIAIPQASRPHYKDTPTDRCSLVEFLLYNGWFEGTYVGGDLSIPWDEEREERLRFWQGRLTACLLRSAMTCSSRRAVRPSHTPAMPFIPLQRKTDARCVPGCISWTFW